MQMGATPALVSQYSEYLPGEALESTRTRRGWRIKRARLRACCSSGRLSAAVCLRLPPLPHLPYCDHDLRLCRPQLRKRDLPIVFISPDSLLGGFHYCLSFLEDRGSAFMSLAGGLSTSPCDSLRLIELDSGRQMNGMFDEQQRRRMYT